MQARALTSLVAVAVVATAIAGCGGDGEGDKKNGAGTVRAEPEMTADASRCRPAGEPRPRRLRKRRSPSFRLAADKTYVARVVTSCGTFEIELDSKEAPRTGGSFVKLAREGFYDGLAFHRIVTGFVIQGGDPRGNGSGGPGYSTRERPPDDVVYSEGVVAMAKTEVEPPGTAGSQFFVVTSPDTGLTPDYALLGKVTKGLDVVRAIGELGDPASGGAGTPLQSVVIEKASVSER